MAWTLTAEAMPSPPGSVSLALTGPPTTAFTIQRNDVDGPHPLRTPPKNTGPSGLVQFVDAEAPFRSVTYSVVSGGVLVVTSNEVRVDDPPGGGGLLRSVLRPAVQYQVVSVITETDIRYATSSVGFPVIGSTDPVVIADKRQNHTGRFQFGVMSLAECDSLMFMLSDGLPFLLRLCPGGQPFVRDTLFYALGVEELRFDRSGRRIVSVDYQSTPWVEGLGETGPGTTWLYSALKAQTEAPTYGHLPPIRATYLDLVLDEIAP